jgi:hypothetical protein
MDEASVAQQLTQMADFIRNEAVEKASEIEAAAAEVTAVSACTDRAFWSSSSLGLDLGCDRRDPGRRWSDLLHSC